MSQTDELLRTHAISRVVRQAAPSPHSGQGSRDGRLHGKSVEAFSDSRPTSSVRSRANKASLFIPRKDGASSGC
jgi:hypothetical protein